MPKLSVTAEDRGEGRGAKGVVVLVRWATRKRSTIRQPDLSLVDRGVRAFFVFSCVLCLLVIAALQEHERWRDDVTGDRIY